MKGKINEHGWLQIQRKIELKLQYCPFSTASSACGDYCPLFGELNPPSEFGKTWDLTLHCGARHTWVFDEFEDERMGG